MALRAPTLLVAVLGLSATACASSGSSPIPAVSSSATRTTATGVQLDTHKNYGNKYADGILPVGDGHYSTSAARVGYVFTCSQYAQNLQQGGGGAQTRGPWFVRNNTAYDVNKKSHVRGSVHWESSLSIGVKNGLRSVRTNELPDHPTGVFPVQQSDPAYAYDRNPNTIAGTVVIMQVPASPTYSTPQCMGGEVGIMLTGVPLFNGFDAGGRDAGAWEVQDDCDGHPQMNGEYHYHTLSTCIKDVSVHTVIGWALDGFPITGPNVGRDNVLTTTDLDVCHGLTSDVSIDGKTVSTYHYVMTEDFPYSASCFHAKPVALTLGGDLGQPQMHGPPP